MRVIPEPIEFEWDEGNIHKNYIKHEVTNKESEEVFRNEPFIVFEDKKHSKNEKRYNALGIADNKKLLFLSFTVRLEKIRIISARAMSKKERRVYKKQKIKVNTEVQN